MHTETIGRVGVTGGLGSHRRALALRQWVAFSIRGLCHFEAVEEIMGIFTKLDPVWHFHFFSLNNASRSMR